MAQEKKTKEIRVMIQPSLYKSFKKECDNNYKTISESIREMITNNIKNASK